MDVLPAAPPAARGAQAAEAGADGPAGAPCASCGAALVGDYCHRCGEKRLGHHDYAFGHWLEHTVDAFTHFDLKVPRSLWSLLRRPGLMTADVLAGRRVRWAKPFQAFLIANVVYYVLASTVGLNTFETPMQYQLETFYGETVRAWSTAKAAALGVTAAEYAERFDALAHTLQKTLVVFFVPVLAAAFWALHPLRRRYALEHVTVGVHFASLILLLPFPTVPLFLGLHVLGVPASEDAIATFVSAALIAVYGAWFCRRVYGDRWLGAALKGAALPFVFYLSLIFLYRPLLFVLITVLL
ncbi:MAG TPA: DUF3667 domain-containing protein [Rubricoccaceae bacterium]